jgi:hypothetical protein
MRERPINPGIFPTSNSTRKSMSLSELKSSRRTDPKRESLLMWFFLQNSAISSDGIDISIKYQLFWL